MTDTINNDDFDFDFIENENLTDEELKERAEREVARFKEEQEQKRVTSDAYDKILGRFKAAPRNDNEHYEAFKAERLERFKTLDTVVADICKKHLHREAYHYESFKNCLFNDNVKHGLIYNLCDIIQRVIHDTNNEYSDDYAELSKERQLSIKVLSIAIIDLAEGNI
ncbi:hypothetical protein [Pseudomonas sp. H1_D04]|jgi:hypothetical protein